MPSETSAAGILNINKPSGPTSHDVVARVRRRTGQRRVGHAGTLDPMATGVLVVCLGKATRIIEYLPDDKSYLATIRFGIITDTWDAEGQVLERRDSRALDLAALEAALPAFSGPIAQVPPMYAALKRDGQPLYRLAREGVTVERAPRAVEIYRLEVVQWQPPDLVLKVDCSKGTYIRSLAHDLGQAVGVGAHLAALVRLASGRFRLEDAVALETLLAEDDWRRYLDPIEAALSHLPQLVVAEETVQRIGFGQAVALDVSGPARLCCIYDAQRQLVAIMRRGEASLWQPEKVFGVSQGA